VKTSVCTSVKVLYRKKRIKKRKTTEQRGKTTAQSINMHHQKCIAEQKNVYRGYSGSRVDALTLQMSGKQMRL